MSIKYNYNYIYIRVFCILILLTIGGCRQKVNDSRDANEIAAQSWEFLQNQNFNAAAVGFTRLAKSADSNIRTEAFFGLGYTQLFKIPPNISKSRKNLKRVIQSDEDGKWTPYAKLLLARSFEIDPSRYSGDDSLQKSAFKAQDIYRKIINKYKSSKFSEEAEFRICVSTLEIAKTNDDIHNGIEQLKLFLNKYPDSLYSSTGYWVLSNIYLTLFNNIDESVKYAKDAVIVGIPEKKTRLDMYYRIAYLSSTNLKDFKTAKEFYQKMLKESAFDPRIYQVKKAISRISQTNNNKPN